MDDRYVGKIAQKVGRYEVVLNRGSEAGIKAGAKFLIVGFGDSIIDPDTGEDLGVLEIVRGSATATHVQEKMSTLKSDEYEKSSGTKEIKKVTSKGAAALMLGYGDTITESTIPGPEVLLDLSSVQVGDFVIRR